MAWTEQNCLFSSNCIKLRVLGLAGFLSAGILKFPIVDHIATCQSPVESFKWLAVWSLRVHGWEKEWHLHRSHPCYENPEESFTNFSTKNCCAAPDPAGMLYPLDIVNRVYVNHAFLLASAVKSPSEIWDSPQREFCVGHHSPYYFIFSLSFSHRIQSRKKLLILLWEYIWIHLFHLQLYSSCPRQ